MNLLARIKAAFTNERWLESTATILRGEEAKRAPFSQPAAIAAYRSWIYAAANLNAIAVASQPLRLYVRNRSTGAKLWNTRKASRRMKAYHAGALEQLPSRYAMTKAAEYGSEYEVVEDAHPILTLLSKVNPYQNGFDAAVLRILYLELTGNAYLHPVIDARLKTPVELWTMPSQYVEVVPGKTQFVDGYLYGASREQRRVFAPDEVIHFKRPNPGDMYYGLGKVEAAWGATMANEAVHEMDHSFFANKARPDYLLVVKSPAHPDEIERLEVQIDSKLRGSKRHGRFLTTTSDIDLKPLSFPPKDLAGRTEIVEEIAAVFGVPVSMLKANDPNLASATVGFASWKATTVLPLLRMDEETLNQSLLPLFGIEDDAFLAYDNPVSEDEKFEFEKLRSMVAGGMMTANEARMREGLDAVEDPHADALLVNGQPLGGTPIPPPFGMASVETPPSALADHDQITIQQAPAVSEPKALAESDGARSATVERKDALSDCVSVKVAKLIGEGYEQPQAVAIAHAMCKEEGTSTKAHCGCSHRKKTLTSDLWIKASKRDAAREVKEITKQEEDIASAVAKVLEKQVREVVAKVRAAKVPTKELVAEVELLLSKQKWRKDIVDSLRPYIEDSLHAGIKIGKETLSKLDALPSNFDEKNTDDLSAYARSESIRLANGVARGVNQYTVVRFGKVLGDGVAKGETIDELADRVQAWATKDGDEERATRNRALTIARTETMRASRASEVQAWKASNLVEGKTWLLAPDSCQFCQAASEEFSQKAIPLEQNFYEKGGGIEVEGDEDFESIVFDYEAISAPPLHPNCRCSLQPKLIDDYQDILDEARAAHQVKLDAANEAAIEALNAEDNEYERIEEEVRRIMQ